MRTFLEQQNFHVLLLAPFFQASKPATTPPPVPAAASLLCILVTCVCVATFRNPVFVLIDNHSVTFLITIYYMLFAFVLVPVPVPVPVMPILVLLFVILF
jgi:hypothetical protein